jgi:GMP synthase (glutamine-hydrolysing)
MMKEILVIRNTPRESPGLIGLLMEEHSLRYQIVDFDDYTTIDPGEYSAVIVLGGPDSANDLTPKMVNEVATIKNAIRAKIPYLGICLGHQVAAKAMGGKVFKCDTPEVGFRDMNGNMFAVKLTPEGRSDRLLANLPGTLTVFQLHGETVQTTVGMTLLGSGDSCKNQIVKFSETAYGIQFHFELTDELLESWITEDMDLSKLDPDKVWADFNSIKTDYLVTGRQLMNNFLTTAGLLK